MNPAQAQYGTFVAKSAGATGGQLPYTGLNLTLFFACSIAAIAVGAAALFLERRNLRRRRTL